MTGKTIGIDMRGLMHASPTGVGQYARGLVQALLQHTQHTYVLFDNQWRRQGVPEWIDQARARIVQTRYPNKLLSATTAVFGRPHLDQLMKKEIGSLDYFFSPNINITALSPKTKHIMTVHDMSFLHYPHCFSKKQRLWHAIAAPKKQAMAAHHIITPSLHTKQDVERTWGIASEKITVVSPAYSPHRKADETQKAAVRQRYNLPSRFIFFLGTIEPRKNLLSLLEAYASLGDVGCPLIIAGAKGWNNRAIHRAIDETPGARYIGYVSETEKHVLYELATLFVYPSLYEGFGFPVLEAMAAGTPVITSTHGSLPEVAGHAACYVDPRNVSALAEGMQQLLSNSDMATSYREKGRTRVEAFTWQRAADSWLSCL